MARLSWPYSALLLCLACGGTGAPCANGGESVEEAPPPAPAPSPAPTDEMPPAPAVRVTDRVTLEVPTQAAWPIRQGDGWRVVTVDDPTRSPQRITLRSFPALEELATMTVPYRHGVSTVMAEEDRVFVVVNELGQPESLVTRSFDEEPPSTPALVLAGTGMQSRFTAPGDGAVHVRRDDDTHLIRRVRGGRFVAALELPRPTTGVAFDVGPFGLVTMSAIESRRSGDHGPLEVRVSAPDAGSWNRTIDVPAGVGVGGAVTVATDGAAHAATYDGPFEDHPTWWRIPPRGEVTIRPIDAPGDLVGRGHAIAPCGSGVAIAMLRSLETELLLRVLVGEHPDAGASVEEAWGGTGRRAGVGIACHGRSVLVSVATGRTVQLVGLAW